MASKDEIAAAIREVEARLDSLLPGIMVNLDRPLPEGTWTVHDALCHMAADVPSLSRWQRNMDAAAAGTSPYPPGFDFDAQNQQGVDARKAQPVEAVVQEIRDGLHSDLDGLLGLDEALLTREVTVRGRLQQASERLKFTSAGHNQLHLDDIENAIKAAAG